MTQHYMTVGYATESICGADMVGRRNPILDTNQDVTTCISCKAILDGRPLYAIHAVSGDGDYQETIRFNTPAEQLAYAETAFDNGAANVTFKILSVEDLRNGE